MNIVYCIVLSLGRASLLPHALKLGAPLLSLFSTHPTEDSDSSLTLSREMQLAEHFAFISSTKDDPNRVTAVCVEADQDRAGITLRVAANTDCLSHTEQELQVVADIMMQASKHGVF